MTFLELAQMAARESGTVSGVLPAAVSGQTGRLAKIVFWVQSAWNTIQSRRTDWLWMRGEFSDETVAGVGRYTPASWSLSRFSRWWPNTLTAYLTAAGNGDEWPLRYLPWPEYRAQFLRGPAQPGRPSVFTVSPWDEICFGPFPDAAYTIRGEYQKGPQLLADNDDVPELPTRFHEVIAWYALILLAEHDEAGLHIATAQRNYRELMGNIERDQLPAITLTGALA